MTEIFIAVSVDLVYLFVRETGSTTAEACRRGACGFEGRILSALQVYIRAGLFPDTENNGLPYLKIPLNLG